MAFSEAFLEWERQTQEEAVQAVALKMLQMNLPLETVSEATGLSIAQLQQLQANRDR